MTDTTDTTDMTDTTGESRKPRVLIYEGIHWIPDEPAAPEAVTELLASHDALIEYSEADEVLSGRPRRVHRWTFDGRMIRDTYVHAVGCRAGLIGSVSFGG